jgi:hypothetical protein
MGGLGQDITVHRAQVLNVRQRVVLALVRFGGQPDPFAARGSGRIACGPTICVCQALVVILRTCHFDIRLCGNNPERMGGCRASIVPMLKHPRVGFGFALCARN